jgi:hypothetical protein
MNHTKGKLKVRGYYAVNELGRAVFDCGCVPMEDEEIKANARRLVACWNACDGVSTESLETGELNVFDLTDRNVELANERDELLAALRKLVEWSEKYPSDRTYSHHRISEIAGALDVICDGAKTLLAKHEEEA